MAMRLFLFALVAAVLGTAASGQAQVFPSRTIRIVVPYAPGGAGDIMGRVLAKHMAKSLGQPVIVENRPGAGAVVAYELAAHAPADGYTVLQVWPSFVINPAIRTDLTYDPTKDFRPVGQAVAIPLAVAVGPTVAARSMLDIVALARAHPGQVFYGTPGVGTTQNVFGETLNLGANIKLVHVPFQGGGAQVTAAAAGSIQVAIGNVTEIAPFAKSGKVRAIAVSSHDRLEGMADVPTMRESGYPELETTNWSGFVVPFATPPSVVARLNTALSQALSSADVQNSLKAQGMSPAPSTPEEFAQLLESERMRFGKIVRASGMKLE